MSTSDWLNHHAPSRPIYAEASPPDKIFPSPKFDQILLAYNLPGYYFVVVGVTRYNNDGSEE
jgi:hypothetical protein